MTRRLLDRLYDLAAWLAALQCVLAIAFFVAAITYLRPMKIAARRRAPSS